MCYEFKFTSWKTKRTSCKIKSTSWEIKSTSGSSKTTSEIVNIRVKRKNSEFKNIEFHNFTVSNETILATKQELFFTKVAPVQSIIEICLQMRTEGEEYHASCVRTLSHYLFSYFCYMVSYGNKSQF